ncbi:PTS transporter subunit IIABC [[Mycoplasma] collis]|uniref:PTS transporter subunit IIABC n=1 Tax=[Mycoplasma] collis TaxID=2127 RepID=UPI00068FD114|nr:PTS transporter subunit IIABC [[Mycoplasma] collis]
MTLFKKKANNVSVNNKNSSSGKWKLIFSKISGAFLLPISIMAIAGLLLGVGATIEKNSETEAGKIFGEFIKALGEPVFAALPLLFTAAFVIAFTNEAGVGVFAAIVGYLTFLAIQTPFFTSVYEYRTISAAKAFELSPDKWEFATDINGVDSYYLLNFDENGKLVENQKYIKDFLGYEILSIPHTFGRGLEASKQIISSSLGIKSMQTSVFGSIIVGIVVSYIYNKFHKIQLPTVISFFGGKRFVSIITIIAMIPLAFVFLLFWPWVGSALNWMGSQINKAPFGIESFIFGFIERSLIPFGLHHAFYAPLWYTSVGGDITSSLTEYHQSVLSKGLTAEQINTALASFKNNENVMTYTDLLNYVSEKRDSFQGDSKISAASLGIKANEIAYLSFGENNAYEATTLPLFTFYEKVLSVKIGRFLQGKYPFMQFGLPAAGLAMILAAPKENRKFAAGIIFPVSVTTFITGVTEPIEFTFLFLSPFLFWGIHAFFCALAFMLMNVLGAHIGQVFSGGFLDLIIYGAIPYLKGTNFWWWAVVGVFYAPIYFVIFYFWIKKFNLATPGRGATKLFTKADYNARKEEENTTQLGLLPTREKEIVLGFGGWDNITAYNNCASRLRYDIVDKSKVDVERIKAAGATGVMFVGDKHAQAIFGPKAEQINALIIAHKNEDLGQELQQITKTRVIFAKDYCTHFKKEDYQNQLNDTSHHVISNDEVSSKNTMEFESDLPVVENLEQIPLEDTQEINVVDLENDDYKNDIDETTSLETNDMVDFSDLTFDAEEEVEEEVEEEQEDGTIKTVVKKRRRYYSKIKNPTYGIVKELSSLEDGVFSEKMVGNGVIIYIPRNVKKAKIYAPFDSIVSAAFEDTKHAYVLTSKNGVSVLIHIGVDTIELKGEGFTSFVKQGDKIKTGDLIAEVDMVYIRENAKRPEIVYVVPQESKKTEIYDINYGRLKAGKVAFKVK